MHCHSWCADLVSVEFITRESHAALGEDRND